MAVSMIRQKLGQKTFTNYVPADGTTAGAFAEALMPGEYQVFTKVSEKGSDAVTAGYRKYTIMIKNDVDVKTYFNIVTSINKSSTDVINALQGKTFNGVKAEIVYVLNEREYTFANNSTSGSTSGGSGS